MRRVKPVSAGCKRQLLCLSCCHYLEQTWQNHQPAKCCACCPQDVVRRFREKHSDWEEFPDKVAFQLNDTHPTLLGASAGFVAGLPFVSACILLAVVQAGRSLQGSWTSLCWT